MTCSTRVGLSSLWGSACRGRRIRCQVQYLSASELDEQRLPPALCRAMHVFAGLRVEVVLLPQSGSGLSGLGWTFNS